MPAPTKKPAAGDSIAEMIRLMPSNQRADLLIEAMRNSAYVLPNTPASQVHRILAEWAEGPQQQRKIEDDFLSNYYLQRIQQGKPMPVNSFRDIGYILQAIHRGLPSELRSSGGGKPDAPQRMGAAPGFDDW